MSAAIIKFPEPFTVHRSIARIITIAGQQYRVTAEDWPAVNACETAMEHALEFARSTANAAPNWDSLADLIMIALGVPKDTVYGCSIIAEPLDTICRDGLPQDFGAGECD